MFLQSMNGLVILFWNRGFRESISGETVCLIYYCRSFVTSIVSLLSIPYTNTLKLPDYELKQTEVRVRRHEFTMIKTPGCAKLFHLLFFSSLLLKIKTVEGKLFILQFSTMLVLTFRRPIHERNLLQLKQLKDAFMELNQKKNMMRGKNVRWK